MNVNEVVTGVVVSHNTKDLLCTAITSIRKHYPKMKIVVVDGSDENDPCCTYIKGLADVNTRVFHVKNNIGHGKGLCLGIKYVTTPYLLVFDSDIEMINSPLEKMLDMMEEDTYGVGYIEPTDLGGHEWGSRKDKMHEGPMKYLHPYFCLIQMKEYEKYPPFIHHGAPAVQTMLDIHRKGLSDVVLKEFEGLGHSSSSGWTWVGEPRYYIRHDTRGTRDVRVKKRKPEIQGVWEKVVDPGVKGVTCITCTGDRPLAFSLSKKWIESQKQKPSRWIIIDDGKVPIEEKLDASYIQYIRREPQETDPKHTMIMNLKEGLRHVLGDKVFIWEDDEYYSPDYIRDLSALLDKYEVVGIGRSKYYHLRSRTFYAHPNMGHASLAQTCFRKSFLPPLNKIIDGDSFLDIRIWGSINPGQVNLKETGKSEIISKDGRGYIFDDKKKSLYVGMKGLPGRGGIGSGHKGIGTHDPTGSKLREWIWNDEHFKIYFNFDKNNFQTENKISQPKSPVINNPVQEVHKQQKRESIITRVPIQPNVSFIRRKETLMRAKAYQLSRKTF